MKKCVFSWQFYSLRFSRLGVQHAVTRSVSYELVCLTSFRRTACAMACSWFCQALMPFGQDEVDAQEDECVDAEVARVRMLRCRLGK